MDDLEREFVDEFRAEWERYRVRPMRFRMRENFPSIQAINIVETNDENATIEELNESGETIRSVVPISSLRDFRR